MVESREVGGVWCERCVGGGSGSLVIGCHRCLSSVILGAELWRWAYLTACYAFGATSLVFRKRRFVKMDILYQTIVFLSVQDC